jgi:hypothetical protein
MYLCMYVCIAHVVETRKDQRHAFRASCETAGMIKDRGSDFQLASYRTPFLFPACVDEVFPTWERAAAAVKWCWFGG